MNDVLTRILCDKRAEVARARASVGLSVLEERIAALPPARGFVAALEAQVAKGRPAVIAEMKRASPSRGLLRHAFDPQALARAYEQAGAAALSVLTDGPYFQGSASDLVRARASCRLPVLRKDFVVDRYQVAESRAMGADACLLIVAALPGDGLADLAGSARDYGLDALIEVHDPHELERALALPEALIGINNRDLKTFATTLETSLALVRAVPAGRLVITESGVGAPEDVARLRAGGLQGFLIGEAFMTAPDPGERLRQLFMGWL